MVTRIWYGATPVAKSDEYLNLMRTVAIPDYRSTPGNKGAYALRRIEGDTAHFLMVTFWESEEAIRAFAGIRHQRGEILRLRQGLSGRARAMLHALRDVRQLIRSRILGALGETAGREGLSPARFRLRLLPPSLRLPSVRPPEVTLVPNHSRDKHLQLKL
jgi:Antibiotic biosynthesis monooxygenase